MKKILGAILALSMIASSFVTTAFAAGSIDFTPKANKDTFDEGATVTVTVTITGSPFCAFDTKLSYDSEVFTWVKGDIASSSTLSAKPTFGNADGFAYASYGVTSNEPTEIEVEDEDTGDITVEPAKWTFYQRFTVNKEVKAGDYTFVLTGNGPANEDSGAELNATYGEYTVHVNGTKADEVKPSVEAAAAEVQYGASTIPGKKTAGFATTVIPANGGAFTKLTANIGNGSVNKDFVIYEGVSIEASTVFGLNITQVPADVTITVNSVKAE